MNLVPTRSSTEEGAALLELALVVPLFFLAILFFFDLARYLATRALLQEAAARTLSIVAKYQSIQKDFASGSEALASSADYQDYARARQELETAFSSFATGSLIGAPGSGRFIELTTWQAEDYNQNEKVAVTGLPAAIIRPGESWYSSLEGRYYQHPGVCSSQSGTGCQTPRSPEDSMENLLKAWPVLVVGQARMRTLLFGQVPVSAGVTGWVQLYPNTPYDSTSYGPSRPAPSDSEPACQRDLSCGNWSDYLCRCCDVETCPAGEHWDADNCECTTCVLSEASCPGNFAYWNCRCDCPSGSSCPETIVHPTSCCTNRNTLVCNDACITVVGGGVGS